MIAPDWFWQRANIGSPTECWPWTGSVSSEQKPYGRFWISGQSFLAHRFALLIAKGPPPKGSPSACHTCDNPICVNPDHLWWGSTQENVADCVAKGRKIHPSRRKINRAEALELRGRGWSYSMIAAHFGVNQASVGKALRSIGQNGPIAPNGQAMRAALENPA